MDLRLVLKRITPSVDALRGFHKLEEENYDASLPLAAATETIEFRDVSLALGGRQILNGFNLTVRGGEKVAIVGENGSGKTTLINLLLRLQEPDSGEILMNGVPISEYNIWRRLGDYAAMRALGTERRSAGRALVLPLAAVAAAAALTGVCAAGLFVSRTIVGNGALAALGFHEESASIPIGLAVICAVGQLAVTLAVAAGIVLRMGNRSPLALLQEKR